MSEVRGSGRECQAVTAQEQRTGVTPRPRSGAASEIAGCNSTGAAERSYPQPEARGGSREEQPQVQGVVAARAQEGLEELSHVQGQEGQR